MKHKDLSGKKFGDLTAIERVADDVILCGDRKTKWLCLCRCGKQISVRSENLTRGKTKSCGCISNRGKNGARLVVNMIGFSVGDLTVTRFSRIKNNSESSVAGAYWICRCTCGNETEVAGSSLRRGNTTSCGCRRGRDSLVASRVKRYLREKYHADTEYRAVKNPSTGRWLPFDVFVMGKFFIEINGVQHYRFSKGWHKDLGDFQYGLSLDKIKREYAKKNGVYIEVDLRKINSFDDIVNYIEGIISSSHQDL